MSLQDRTPKNRNNRKIETLDVFEEVKVKKMAYKSQGLRRLNSRNRASTEPKIMLKKMRSIKLYKVYSLKKKGAVHLDWQSTDSSCSYDSSSNQSTTDHRINTMSFSDGKKDFQVESESEGDSHNSSSSASTARMPLSLNQNGSTNAGKERNKMSKSKKHTCQSCFRPFDNDTKPRLTNPLEQSSVERSDASLDCVKSENRSVGQRMQVEATSHNSVNGFLNTNSSEHSMTGSKSASTRTVRNLRNKTSFKIKSSSVGKAPKVVQDLGLNRATCSSTLKDSKFPKQVELEPGKSESEIFSTKKVCPYHHCSLHGHSRVPEPPPKRFLFRRRRSEKTPKSKEQKGLSPNAVTSSGDKKKPIQTGKRFSHMEPAAVKPNCSKGSTNVKEHNTLDSTGRTIAKLGTEAYKGAPQEKENATAVGILNFKSTEIFPAPEQEIWEPVPSKLEKASDFCYVETNQDKSPSTTKLKSEVFASSADNDVISANFTGIDKDEPPSHVASKDIAKATRGSTVVSPTNSYTPEELGATREEKDGTPYAEFKHISDPIPHRDSTVIENNNVSTESNEAGKVQIKKNDHISMWHMIHHHMVLGLAENTENQKLNPRYEVGQASDAMTVRGLNSSQLNQDISNSDIADRAQDIQVLELRKVFAIKLVREAIEKILLPEVEGQTSDVISITSENVSDEEHPEQSHDEGEEKGSTTSNKSAELQSQETDHKELEGDKPFDLELSPKEVNARVPEKDTQRNNTEKKTLKGWSNLRKIILLKRFVKELEKVKTFNPVQPHQLASEPISEAEKISLRSQTIGGKKSAEEWMLDYALRQVVSELAPTQKKKVALLVKAFETVVPPHEDQNIKVTTPELRIPTDLKDKEIQSNLYLNSDLQSGGPEYSVAALDDSRSLARKPSSLLYSSGAEKYKEIQADSIIPTLGTVAQIELSADKEETKGESRVKDIVLQELPLLTASDPSSIANQEHKTRLDKQNFKMWHMIYRHVVSGIAEKVGNQLLDADGEDEDDVNDVNKLLDGNSSGSSLKTDHYDSKENHDKNHQKIEFNRSAAVKLIQDAVDEILLPDIKDDSSDSQSIASDILPDQEMKIKHQGDDEETSILNSTESTEDGFKYSTRNIEQSDVSLDQETKASIVEDINAQDSETAKSLLKTSLVQQKSKNWSKLKKLIILKRSIKALENVRKLNQKPPQQLPSTTDPEEENIKLKQQMMDERKKAEQWMLDYAVQHIVTKLTPARKRRVAMLVEAFEAVVPLPEV